jgi:hypothetical protein
MARNMTHDSTGESAATTLIGLAKVEADLFHWGDDCFATISRGEHMETHAVRSRSFRSFLGKRFFEQSKRAASGESLTSAIQTLEGIARFEGVERPVGVRIQSYCGKIYFDLANDDWQVVESFGRRTATEPSWRDCRKHKSIRCLLRS